MLNYAQFCSIMLRFALRAAKTDQSIPYELETNIFHGIFQVSKCDNYSSVRLLETHLLNVFFFHF